MKLIYFDTPTERVVTSHKWFNVLKGVSIRCYPYYVNALSIDGKSINELPCDVIGEITNWFYTPEQFFNLMFSSREMYDCVTSQLFHGCKYIMFRNVLVFSGNLILENPLWKIFFENVKRHLHFETKESNPPLVFPILFTQKEIKDKYDSFVIGEAPFIQSFTYTNISEYYFKKLVPKMKNIKNLVLDSTFAGSLTLTRVVNLKPTTLTLRLWILLTYTLIKRGFWFFNNFNQKEFVNLNNLTSLDISNNFMLSDFEGMENLKLLEKIFFKTLGRGFEEKFKNFYFYKELIMKKMKIDTMGFGYFILSNQKAEFFKNLKWLIFGKWQIFDRKRYDHLQNVKFIIIFSKFGSDSYKFMYFRHLQYFCDLQNQTYLTFKILPRSVTFDKKALKHFYNDEIIKKYGDENDKNTFPFFKEAKCLVLNWNYLKNSNVFFKNLKFLKCSLSLESDLSLLSKMPNLKWVDFLIVFVKVWNLEFDFEDDWKKINKWQENLFNYFKINPHLKEFTVSFLHSEKMKFFVQKGEFLGKLKKHFPTRFRRTWKQFHFDNNDYVKFLKECEKQTPPHVTTKKGGFCKYSIIRSKK